MIIQCFTPIIFNHYQKKVKICVNRPKRRLVSSPFHLELIKLIEALQQQHSMRLAEKDHDHVKILQQLESQTTKINLGNSL